MRKGRFTTGVLLWLAAAAAATLVGTTAVSAIGTDILGGGQDPLSAAEVDALLSSRPAPPQAPTTTTKAPPATTSEQLAAPQQLQTDTAGGTVVSQCTPDGGVQVLTATPAQGYHLDSDDRGGDHPGVEFKAGRQKVEIRLRCVDGVPSAEVRLDD